MLGEGCKLLLCLTLCSRDLGLRDAEKNLLYQFGNLTSIGSRGNNSEEWNEHHWENVWGWLQSDLVPFCLGFLYNSIASDYTLITPVRFFLFLLVSPLLPFQMPAGPAGTEGSTEAEGAKSDQYACVFPRHRRGKSSEMTWVFKGLNCEWALKQTSQDEKHSGLNRCFSAFVFWVT